MHGHNEPTAISAETALRIGHELERWRQTGAKTQRDLGRIAKVSQGQVSRILAGKFSHAAPPVVRLCAAAGIELQIGSESAAKHTLRRRLHAEVDRCWDGSQPGATALIELLRAAGRLRPPR